MASDKRYTRKSRNGDAPSGWVEIETVMPVFDRLIAIFGTKAKVAEALGVGKQGFLAPTKISIQRKTLDRALALLKEFETDLANHPVIPLEVVSAEELSKILRAWVVTYLADNHDSNQYDGIAGPTEVVADRAGMSRRQVSRYMNNDNESQWVSVYIADKLLMAIDQHYLLSNGVLVVVANPILSMESWVKHMEQRGCI
jgi:hypothetical protein